MAQLGVPKEIRDRVLNHVTALRDPESKHYNVYEFAAEKRDALNRWGDAVSTILKSGVAVTPLRRSA